MPGVDDITRTVFFVMIWLITTASPGLGSVLIVDGAGGGEFTTINAALSAAAAGDTVLIRPGTYHESVRITSDLSGLWLEGDGGPDNVTVTADTVAIGAWDTDPSIHIRALTVTGSSAFGGLYLQHAKAEIVGCVFRANVGPGECHGVGGGINASYQSDVQIEDCVIEANTDWESPGGVIIWESHADIRRNTFRNNQACYGGGLEMYHCETQPVSFVEENVFFGNSADEWGGGLLNVDSSPVIRHNTFYANNSVGNAAIWVLGGQPTISENIIVGSDWGVYCQTDLQYPPSSPVLDCNLFWNVRLGATYECNNVGRMIQEDPRFCDPAGGNFLLCEDSPAVSDTCGTLGALGVGCGPCAQQTAPTTWGKIKAGRFYRGHGAQGSRPEEL